jgi:uncharacterized protein YciI
MKKVLALVGIIGLTTFVACGPSKEEQEKAEAQRIADSTRVADSTAAADAAAAAAAMPVDTTVVDSAATK